MKLDSADVLRRSKTDVATGIDPSWRRSLIASTAVLAAILAVHWTTFESIVAIWERSETFAHGYLIVPISLWLIWAKRREVSQLRPQVDRLGFFLLLGAALLWLLAYAGKVQVVAQYAAVAMLPFAVIAVLGRDVAMSLAFPLAFLFFAVPVGEFLILPLMDRTADFVVAALRGSGIPVYREGNFFEIPSGSWSVVEGCSGLRYLIASITVGTLFAYLTYQLLWKRVLFVAASIVIPIFANWLRAYIIVMLGHISGNKLANGVDHLIYGWVFFGIVMLLLFWVGSFWRDEPLATIVRAPGAAANDGAPIESASSVRWTPTMAAAAFAILLVAAAPLYAAYLDTHQPAEQVAVHWSTPAPRNGWSPTAAPMTNWRPDFKGQAASVFQTYSKDDRVVALYLAYYPTQRRGAELVTSTNVLVVQKHPVWSNVGEFAHRFGSTGNGLELRETRLRSAAQRLLVWDWYRVGGHDLTSPYVAKLLFARDRLLDRGDPGAAIMIATPYDEPPEQARQVLASFLADMAPSIDATLAAAQASLR